MKKCILVIGMALMSVLSFSQDLVFGYFEDALRFSQTNSGLGSSARIQAIGGAQYSLGGDISSAVSNPAGLGFFNKSVFTVSPSLNFTTALTDFFIEGDNSGVISTQESITSNFNIANVGAVINWNKGRFTNDPFKGGSLAISINRSNGFRLDRAYQGENNANSLADALADQSFNVDLDNISELAFAAFDQYLITPEIDQNNNIVYQADFSGFPVQDEQIRESGSQYQMNIAWGGNYDDRFYFGGGMGLQFINYRRERNFTEFDFGSGSDLIDFNLTDDLNIRGTGVNFNVGIIARPVSFMTVGVSYTSPSFIAFDEESFLDLDADWREGATGDNDGESVNLSTIDPYQSALFVSNYSLRTPSRLGVGTTLFIGKTGFLSGDVEFVDYSGSTISSQDFITTGDNQVIEDLYASVINVRVGGEYRIQHVMLRAGYALFPSPYQDSNLSEQTNLTFGIGYRNADYFLDLAVVNSERTLSYIPYTSLDAFQPVASSTVNNTAVTLTFGLNF